MNQFKTTNGKQISIRAAREDDLASVSQIHREGFATGLLGHCSVALIREYYSAFLQDSSLIFIVAIDRAGAVAGYALGGEGEALSACVRKFVRSSWLRAAYEVVRIPALWPRVWKRACSILLPLHGRHTYQGRREPYRLLAIAVSSSAQRSGVASALMGAFEAAIPPQISSYGLSVHRWNEAAKKLYLKRGFVEEGATPESLYLRRALEREQAVGVMAACKAEQDRMQRVYSGNFRRSRNSLYLWHRPGVLWGKYRLHAVTASMLVKNEFSDLSAFDVLDVGCGGGSWLRTLVEWGVRPDHAHGVDILPERIAEARSRAQKDMDFREYDGGPLPYADGSMDLVTAHTVFSSILDPALRRRLAADMLRVCRPARDEGAGGVIMVYDFRIKDPRNPDTVSIDRNEFRRLFPGCAIQFRSLTLAPPLSRRLAPWSMPLVAALEWCLPFLRTHLLALIRPGNLS